VEAKKSNRFGLSKAVLFFGHTPKAMSDLDTLVEKSTRSNFQLSISNGRASEAISVLDTLAKKSTRSNFHLCFNKGYL
jgi:hypothetical protein